jgi:hypothetical protein
VGIAVWMMTLRDLGQVLNDRLAGWRYAQENVKIKG